MRRADRLFQIIQYLRTRQVTTAKWLAEQLEVSERTIYRDMRDLMATGVHIEGEAGVGYALRYGYDLPPLMFNQEELTALVLGASLVSSWADVGLAKAADQAMRKIESVLPTELSQYLSTVSLFSPAVQISTKVADMMSVLREAIDKKQKINMTYQRADEVLSQRVVWPLGLFFWRSVWVLGAWCESRDDFRHFRLDRIVDQQISEVYYPLIRGRTLSDLIARAKQATKD